MCIIFILPNGRCVPVVTKFKYLGSYNFKRWI